MTPVHDTVQHRRLRYLLTDSERWIEGGGRTLGEIGDPPAAEFSQGLAIEGQYIGVVEKNAPGGDAATGP